MELRPYRLLLFVLIASVPGAILPYFLSPTSFPPLVGIAVGAALGYVGAAWIQPIRYH